MASRIITNRDTESSVNLHQDVHSYSVQKIDPDKNDLSKIEVPLPWGRLVTYCHAKDYSYPEVSHFFHEINLPIDQQRYSQYKGLKISEEDISFIDNKFEWMRKVRFGNSRDKTKTYFWDFIALITVGFSINKSVELLQRKYAIDMNLYKLVLPFLYDVTMWNNYNNGMFREWLRAVDIDLCNFINMAQKLQKPGVLTKLKIKFDMRWAVNYMLRSTSELYERACEDGDQKYKNSLLKELLTLQSLRADLEKEEKISGESEESEVQKILKKLNELTGDGG